MADVAAELHAGEVDLVDGGVDFLEGSFKGFGGGGDGEDAAAGGDDLGGGGGSPGKSWRFGEGGAGVKDVDGLGIRGGGEEVEAADGLARLVTIKRGGGVAGAGEDDGRGGGRVEADVHADGEAVDGGVEEVEQRCF